MAIKLKAQTYGELLEVTAEILLSAEVHSGLFISLKSIDEFSRCDEILARHGQTSKYLAKIIDEPPFQSFANEWLSRRLYGAGHYDAGSPRKNITEMNGFADPVATARELLDGMCALPNTFKFTLQLPSSLDAMLPPDLDEYNFSDQLRLLRITEAVKQSFPAPAPHGSAFDGEPTKNKLLLHAGVAHTSRGQICIQYEGEGEIGLVHKLAVEKKAEVAFKSFLGIAQAIQFIEQRPYLNNNGNIDTIYIHMLRDDAWRFATVGTIEAALKEGLSLIALNDQAVDNSEYNSWCLSKLHKVSTCFSDHEGAERIRLASQWLFDSYGGNNQLLSFVQATICMEILFGTGDKDFTQGLVNIMKNRCAYLIGSSHKDRKKIMDQFASIYKVRSTIVHSGQNELSKGEAEMLHTLRGMCNRAIAAEIKLISADSMGTLGALFDLGSAMDQ